NTRNLVVTDNSYDLDRYSASNKGIVQKLWKWRSEHDTEWRTTALPTTLAANTDYMISLQVRDIDGAWSNEVIKEVSTRASNQPPIAKFTTSAKSISWNKSLTITDTSF